jgi:hypothetical protein
VQSGRLGRGGRTPLIMSNIAAVGDFPLNGTVPANTYVDTGQ